ncbi:MULTISPECIES: signal peptidase I [Pseudomonas]|uniref:signal peptidase I n=1 Tax=Pseudomonas nitroreducens TaxID=46680 RepID=UPI001E5C92BF|nr:MULTISPECIES: signal peptidase I [Pseudomonas]MCE4067742.1 signal peptidase I [Pseudomonas nitritireducens]MCE4076931.1 signal peptidase I [Pseudomonas nitroreducens]
MTIPFWRNMAVPACLLGGLYILNPLGVPSQDPRLRLLGGSTFSIKSSSMTPGLQPGDYILVNAATYAFGEPVDGEVVVFRPPDNPAHIYIKRIAGRPGDRLRITGGKLFVNGREVTQSYLDASQNQREDSRRMQEQVVPEGQYFMLGDNRDNSQDSRYFGYVPRANLIGRAAYVWYAKDSTRIGPLR